MTLLRHIVMLTAAVLMVAQTSSDAGAARLKDVAYVDGVRPNQLIGYGLVVGLDGTGDTQRVGFTRQSLTAMLSRSGVRYDDKNLILRNVGAVIVTAKLPAFARPGARIDVTVSSIGNARSLAGGTLLMTPLSGPDGKPYALAQGPLQVGGFTVGGRSAAGRLRQNHLNTGRVAGGGLVEKSVPIALSQEDKLTLRIRKPDFTTAANLTRALNGAAGRLGGAANWAKAVDAGTVELAVRGKKPEQLPLLIAGLENLNVEVGTASRVVINGRTGTVVVGGDVRISAVAVAHHGVSLEIAQQRQLFQNSTPATGQGTQPPPDRRTPIQKGQLQVVPAAATLADLVKGLNALGVQPRELVHILQAISAAGALQGQLEVL